MLSGLWIYVGWWHKVLNPLCIKSILFLFPSVPPVIIKFEEPQKWHDTCMIFTVRANPLPTMRWYYKGEEIKPTEYVHPEMDIYQDNLEGCLMFKNPTHHNNGNYTLEASNFLGVAVKTVYAHFLRPPFDGMWLDYFACYSKTYSYIVFPNECSVKCNWKRFSPKCYYTCKKYYVDFPPVGNKGQVLLYWCKRMRRVSMIRAVRSQMPCWETEQTGCQLKSLSE